jgi:hypothetical protein
MSVASQKSVEKAQEEKVFYSLDVTWDPKQGMQIRQNSNRVGPADIIMALEVVSGMHKKYFIDAFSQQVAQNAVPAIKEMMEKK